MMHTSPGKDMEFLRLSRQEEIQVCLQNRDADANAAGLSDEESDGDGGFSPPVAPASFPVPGSWSDSPCDFATEPPEAAATPASGPLASVVVPPLVLQDLASPARASPGPKRFSFGSKENQS